MMPFMFGTVNTSCLNDAQIQALKFTEQKEEIFKITQIINMIIKNNKTLTPHEIKDVAKIIFDETKDNSLTPMFILAVIKTESGFQKNVTSNKGAIGLMQLLPTTATAVAKDYGITIKSTKMIYNPALNVKLGITYLKRLKNRFGNTNLALAAYNMGPTLLNNVRKKYNDKYVYKYTLLVRNNKSKILL